MIPSARHREGHGRPNGGSIAGFLTAVGLRRASDNDGGPEGRGNSLPRQRSESTFLVTSRILVNRRCERSNSRVDADVSRWYGEDNRRAEGNPRTGPQDKLAAALIRCQWRVEAWHAKRRLESPH